MTQISIKHHDFIWVFPWHKTRLVRVGFFPALGNTIMARLFVSGHCRTMQGAGMKTLKISSAEREAVCLERSLLLHSASPQLPGTADSQRGACSWPGMEPRGSWAGVSYSLHQPADPIRPQQMENEAASSSAEQGADGLSCGLQLWRRLSFLQPRALFTSVQLWGPPNAAQLLKAKMSSKRHEPNYPATSVCLQSHPIKCPLVTKQNESVRCRARARTLLQWLVDRSYLCLHGKGAIPAPGKTVERTPHLHRG